MNWLKKHWPWLLVTIIPLLLLVPTLGMLSSGLAEGGRELGGAVHVTGEWAVRWLVLSLSCTPLYILFGWRQLLPLRKPLGLYALLYALLHTLAFLAEEGWQPAALFGEFYLIVGVIATLVMAPLALTSTQWSMQRLGQWWKPLHRLAYAAGILSVLHIAFAGEGSAILYAVLLGAGLLLRLPPLRETLVSRWQRRRHQKRQAMALSR